MIRFPTRAALLAAGALTALPAVAGAQVQHGPAGPNGVFIRSDGASDRIVLDIAADGRLLYVPNGGPAVVTDAFASSGDIRVAGNGGADVIDASALATSYLRLAINGGDGNDTLVGAPNDDVITGDGGDDVITGGGSTAVGDTIEAGGGDDRVVWNDGDGSVDVDGGTGFDALEVNGSLGGSDTIGFSNVGVAAGHLLVARTRLDGVPDPLSKVDVTAIRRIHVNGLGGNDSISADNGGVGAVATDGLVLDGGAGDDLVSGAETNDRVDGGDGSDIVNGGGGDDRLTGGRGQDTLNGADGDDTLAWSDGDDADVANGDGGTDTVEVRGSSRGEQFAARPSGNRALLSIDGSGSVTLRAETLAIDSLGGDDVVTVEPATPIASVRAEGGAGQDSLAGAGEADVFFGGVGDDRLTGGAGADLLDGGDGADLLFARDATADLVRGGAGLDGAQTDQITLDAIDGTETLDAIALPAGGGGAAPGGGAPAGGSPPIGDVRAFAPSFGRLTATRARSRLSLKVPLTCPVAETGGCRATVSVATSGAVRLGGAKVVVSLGSARVSLAKGQSKTVTIKLNAAAAKLVKGGRLGVRVSAVSSDAAGNQASSAKVAKVGVPKAKQAR